MTDEEIVEKVTQDIASGVDPDLAAERWITYAKRVDEAPGLAIAAIQRAKTPKVEPPVETPPVVDIPPPVTEEILPG